MLRFGGRAHGREILQSHGVSAAIAYCGTGIQHGKRTCSVVRRMDDSLGSFTGVCKCANALVCPVCAPRIGGKRSEQITAVESWHKGNGGVAHLLTFTMPHRADEPLGSLIWDFQRAREIAFKGRNYSRLKDLRVGYVAGNEINWSARSGWHFHRHEAVFGAYSFAEYAFLHDRWMAGLKAVDRYSKGVEQHAFDARVGAASEYVSKLGFEIAFAPAKESRSLISLLVQDFCEPMTTGMHWLDGAIAVATCHVNSVRSSKGLYAAAGVVETSDQDDAAEAFEAGDEVLGDLEAWQFRRVILRKKEYQIRLAAQDGKRAVNSLLRSIGAGQLINPTLERPDPRVGKPTGQQFLC